MCIMHYNIERSERKCKMFDYLVIEDEFHFILKCIYILKYYWFKPSVFKLVQLLSAQNRIKLCNLGEWLKHALFLRSQHD